MRTLCARRGAGPPGRGSGLVGCELAALVLLGGAISGLVGGGLGAELGLVGLVVPVGSRNTGQALGGVWGEQGGEGGQALQAGQGGQGVQGLRVLEQLGQGDGTGAQPTRPGRPALTYFKLRLVQFHAGGDKGPQRYHWHTTPPHRPHTRPAPSHQLPPTLKSTTCNAADYVLTLPRPHGAGSARRRRRGAGRRRPGPAASAHEREREDLSVGKASGGGVGGRCGGARGETRGKG